MKKKTNKGGIGESLAVGVGVAAVSAAAYLLFGPEGQKNRKKIKGWSIKMKGEMIEKFEEAKEVTEPIYNKIVDEISEKYSKVKGIEREDIDEVVADVKKSWKMLMKDAKKGIKKPIKKVLNKKK